MVEVGSVDAVRDDEGRLVVRLRDTVRLYDTDASGLIFFGALTRWMTDAHSELFAALGHRIGFGTGYGMPVRAAELEYLGPLAQHDRIEVVSWVDRVGRTSVRIVCEVRCGGEVRARGATTHVNVSLSDMQPVELPPAIVAAAWSDG